MIPIIIIIIYIYIEGFQGICFFFLEWDIIMELE